MAGKLRQRWRPSFFFFFFSGVVLSGQFLATAGAFGGESGLVRISGMVGYMLGTTIRLGVSLVGRKRRQKVSQKPAKKENINTFLHRRASKAAFPAGTGRGDSWTVVDSLLFSFLSYGKISLPALVVFGGAFAPRLGFFLLRLRASPTPSTFRKI